MKLAQGKKTPGKVLTKIRAMARANFSTAEILKRLSEDDEILPDAVPEERTIQKYRSLYAPVDPWHPYAEDWRHRPDDARVVLQILREMLFITGGRMRSFTKDEAEAVCFVARIAPDLSMQAIWVAAEELLLGERLEAVEQFLAFHTPGDEDTSWAKWRERYDVAEAKGFVEPRPEITIDYFWGKVEAGRNPEGDTTDG